MPYNFTHALVGLTALDSANQAVKALAAQHRGAFLIGTMGPDPYFGDAMPRPLFAHCRVDLAEKLLHAAHGLRVGSGKAPFGIDPAMAVSMGLGTAAYAQLLRLAGFQPIMPRPLPKGAFGPAAPLKWRWRPTRRQIEAARPTPRPATSAFAALAELVR